ncbi:hypothetical protein [Cohnella abietis]|nr:hypothetical protein [Cohnella abietis]
MPRLTTNDPSQNKSLSISDPREKVSKKMVLDLGMSYLEKMGSGHICKVCISYGGSCCSGCEHLSNGVGCTLRNTSCTAWLCGFLKFLLYETGHLQEWNDYWEQVPGQDHRMDFTPETFFIHKSLHVQSLGNLSEALAADLQELARTHSAIGFIFTLREKIDRNIDQFIFYKDDPVKKNRLKRSIVNLSSPFHRFHIALNDYRAIN